MPRCAATARSCSSPLERANSSSTGVPLVKMRDCACARGKITSAAAAITARATSCFIGRDSLFGNHWVWMSSDSYRGITSCQRFAGRPVGKSEFDDQLTEEDREGNAWYPVLPSMGEPRSSRLFEFAGFVAYVTRPG